MTKKRQIKFTLEGPPAELMAKWERDTGTPGATWVRMWTIELLMGHDPQTCRGPSGPSTGLVEGSGQDGSGMQGTSAGLSQVPHEGPSGPCSGPNARAHSSPSSSGSPSSAPDPDLIQPGVDVPEFTAGLLRILNAALKPGAKRWDVQDQGGSVLRLVWAALKGEEPHGKAFTAVEIETALRSRVDEWKGTRMASNLKPSTLLGKLLGEYVVTAGVDTTSQPTRRLTETQRRDRARANADWSQGGRDNPVLPDKATIRELISGKPTPGKGT